MQRWITAYFDQTITKKQSRQSTMLARNAILSAIAINLE